MIDRLCDFKFFDFDLTYPHLTIYQNLSTKSTRSFKVTSRLFTLAFATSYCFWVGYIKTNINVLREKPVVPS